MHLFRPTSKNKKLAFLAGMFVMFGILVLAGVVTVGRVHAADCNANSIMNCGFTNPTDFINQVNKNKDSAGHTDLQAVYAHPFASGQALTKDMYGAFANRAVAGKAFKNNTIVVNGQTVATNTISIGRLASFQGSNYKTYPIKGVGTYYGNTNDKAFASDGLPVYVLFDSQGNMQFAVIQSCGNPIFGTPKPSSASCKVLNAQQVSGHLDTYNFSAQDTHTGNAVITKYVYDFGDGSTQTIKSDFGQTVQHKYTRGGTFMAKITVFARFPGSSTEVPLQVITNCTKVVNVPFYRCLQLAGPAIDQTKMSFQFVATAQFGGGASFTSADFNFGDGHSAKGVKPTGNVATVNYTYPKTGRFDASAILHFNANGQSVTAPTCSTFVTPTQPPTPECKPGIPVGSPLCTPCQFDVSLPANSPKCLPPELPNTGAGNTIAITGIAAVLGFLGYRQYLYRQHKKAFLSVDQGGAPLPLGQPLDEESPLAGTPYQRQHRRSFRRRRQF